MFTGIVNAQLSDYHLGKLKDEKYEGTDNLHTLVLGKHLAGINAFA